MSKWFTDWRFSLAGASVVIAVLAYRPTRKERHTKSDPDLWQSPSIALSLLLASVPAALFFAGTYQARRTEFVFQAAGCLFIALLFFVSSRFSAAGRAVLRAVLAQHLLGPSDAHSMDEHLWHPISRLRRCNACLFALQPLTSGRAT